MEQDPEGKDPEQEEVWAAAEAAEDNAEAAAARGVVSAQARGAFASAPTAGKKWPINWGSPATSSHVPIAGPPWRGNRGVTPVELFDAQTGSGKAIHEWEIV